MSTIRKVTFESVSAIGHPEYYQGDQPRVTRDQVPDEHWTKTEREGDGVDDQHRGLLQLIEQGELIRNVRLFEGEAAATEWREIGEAGAK